MRIESVKGFDLRGEDAQDVALVDHSDFIEAWPKGRVLVVVEIVPDEDTVAEKIVERVREHARTINAVEVADCWLCRELHGGDPDDVRHVPHEKRATLCDGCAAMVNAFQGEPPGEKIALRCVFLRCGHTWQTDRARWETGLDDNCCPECEDPNPVEITRREWKQEADAEHEAHQDALRKRLREGL